MSTDENLFPTELRRTDDGELVIYWSDGLVSSIRLRTLRERCPCAQCESKKSETPKPGVLNILSPAEARPLSIVKMVPVGNYAYSVHFSDGHHSGLYAYELLRSLGS